MQYLMYNAINTKIKGVSFKKTTQIMALNHKCMRRMAGVLLYHIKILRYTKCNNVNILSDFIQAI